MGRLEGARRYATYGRFTGLPSASTRPVLDRSIGLLEATAMVVGTIVGASIFVQPTEISRYVPSIPGMLAVWLLAGLLTFSGAQVAAELAAALPFTGGVYVFLRETGLFAFGGWHMVTYAAGETRDPARTIPRALLIGTLAVTACYLALNAACLRVLSLSQVIRSPHVAADVASALAGSRGAAAVSGLVILSSLGVLNGVILAGPRVYLAMAQDGLGIGWMGAVHARFRTPYRAILAQAVWASLLVATGTYRALFTRVIYTEWLFFALMTAGLFRLRRRIGYAPEHRAWGYPLVPVLFLIAALVVVFNQVAADPLESSKGLFLVAAGLPVYYLWARPQAGIHAHH